MIISKSHFQNINQRPSRFYTARSLIYAWYTQCENYYSNGTVGYLMLISVPLSKILSIWSVSSKRSLDASMFSGNFSRSDNSQY